LKAFPKTGGVHFTIRAIGDSFFVGEAFSLDHHGWKAAPTSFGQTGLFFMVSVQPPAAGG
jgi:hypothetical protein